MAKILHVIKWMGRGGAETWLMHVLRHIDREKFKMDFLVQSATPGDYDSEIRKLGSKIIPCDSSSPFRFARNFRRILRENGPYDVVHSHLHHFSGYVLRLAYQAGIPGRISHSHSDTAKVDDGFYRKAYRALTELWVSKYSTAGLACSKNAAADLFGPSWEIDPRWRVYYCGIDMTPFAINYDRVAVRSELGIPEDAFVIGHAGRFTPVKNHTFLVKVAAEINKLEPMMRLLLIGSGELRSLIQDEIYKAGLSDRTVFTGIRTDVPRLMAGAMDVFLFPSLYEGLGLVLIEAQAAGLPCFFSDSIPDEVRVVKPLTRQLSLSLSPSVWANEILSVKNSPKPVNQPQALSIMERSPFNIITAVKELERLYLNYAKKNSFITQVINEN